jgi:UPF0716 protein FxsA
MRVFLLLLPWLELFTLIQLGIKTSALTALAYVFLTLVAGLALLNLQGRDMFRRLREAQEEGRIFGPQMLVDDMAVGVAALLLIIPGMITDAAAILVLVGPLRRRLSRWLFGDRAQAPRDGEVQRDWRHDATIEGDYRRVDDEDR